MKKVALVTLLMISTSLAQVKWNNKEVVRELATINKICVLPFVDLYASIDDLRATTKYVEDYMAKQGFTIVKCTQGEAGEEATLRFDFVQHVGVDYHYVVNPTSYAVWPHYQHYGRLETILISDRLTYKVLTEEVPVRLYNKDGNDLDKSLNDLMKTIQKARKKVKSY